MTWTHDPTTGADVWRADEQAAAPTGCPPDAMRLRDAIAQAERNAGTGRALAEILGVTPATICRWKSEQTAPRWDVFMRLVEVAGVSAHDVMLP